MLELTSLNGFADLPAAQRLTLVAPYTVPALRAQFGQDPWLSNLLVNHREYLEGAEIVTSYPWNVTIPISDTCNARCGFCTSWLRGDSFLQPDNLNHMADLLRHAARVSLQGHGEPLINAHFSNLVARIAAQLDPRASMDMVTNGARLRQHMDAVANNIRGICCSLNAASATTHDLVMGMGSTAFDHTCAGLRELIHRRDNQAGKIAFISLSFVVTSLNLQEVPDFVRLAEDLGVDKIFFRTLAPQNSLTEGLNYHLLPPYLRANFAQELEAAKAAIQIAKIEIDADPEGWATPVLHGNAATAQPEFIDRRAARKLYPRASHYDKVRTQPNGQPINPNAAEGPTEVPNRANPYKRTAPSRCTYIYFNFLWNDFSYQLNPCCYSGTAPDHSPVWFDGSIDFFEAWNSPAFRAIRRSLRRGPLLDICLRCPKQPEDFGDPPATRIKAFDETMWTDRIRSLIDRGDYDGAAQLVKHVAELYPNSTELPLLRARLAIAGGDYQTAEPLLMALVTSDLRPIDTVVELADALYDAGRPRAAKEIIQQALTRLGGRP